MIPERTEMVEIRLKVDRWYFTPYSVRERHNAMTKTNDELWQEFLDRAPAVTQAHAMNRALFDELVREARDAEPVIDREAIRNLAVSYRDREPDPGKKHGYTQAIRDVLGLLS